LTALEHRTRVDQANLDRWHGMLEDNLTHFRALVEAGVHFVAGTDAGWGYSPFPALVDEIELMHQGGLSAMEAIVAATSRAAQALAIDGTTGTIRDGLAADLIVVDGDPLAHVRALDTVSLVMKNGTIVA